MSRLVLVCAMAPSDPNAPSAAKPATVVSKRCDLIPTSRLDRSDFFPGPHRSNPGRPAERWVPLSITSRPFPVSSGKSREDRHARVLVRVCPCFVDDRSLPELPARNRVIPVRRQTHNLPNPYRQVADWASPPRPWNPVNAVAVDPNTTTSGPRIAVRPTTAFRSSSLDRREEL